MLFSNTSNDHFIIKQLLMVETGTYHNMMARPYQANGDQIRVDRLREATQGGSIFKPSALAGVAGQILTPSSHTDGSVSIVNGWGTNRFRFMMEVEISGPFDAGIIYILTGYTDHADVTLSGMIDPNMQFYFNNCIMLSTVDEWTPSGVVQRYRLVEAAHVLTGGFDNDRPLQSIHQSRQVTMRPEDLFCNLGLGLLNDSSLRVSDKRTNFAAGAKLSRRSHGAATSYLGNALAAHKNAMNAAEATANLGDIMQEAQGQVRDPFITSNKPLYILKTKTSWGQTGAVSFHELSYLCPHLDDVTHIQFARSLKEVANTYNREHFQGSTHETIAVTMLSQAIPALMVDCILTSVYFNINNDNYGGKPEFNWGFASGFADIDLSPFQIMFENRFLTEIFPDITHNNQLLVSIEAMVDIRADSNFSISIEGRPPIDYTVPSFSDGLMASVVSNNDNNLRHLASTIGHLSDQLVNY